MIYALRHPFKSLKKFLPKTMFGRSLFILIAPLVLVQTISAYIFFDRHWEYTTKVLARDIAGDVSLLADLYEKNPKSFEFIKGIAGSQLGFSMKLLPQKKLQKATDPRWIDSFLDFELQEKLRRPYQFEISNTDIIIETEVNKRVLEFTTPRKRLLPKTTPLFVMWAAGTSIFFLFVAAIFMRNQVKPLRRLAIAADRFGKGRDFPDFKPEGATEVRKVAQAFLSMKDRLKRQIGQRTEMLAGVSHDLRTPLTRMKLQLAMMDQNGDVKGLITDVSDMERMVEGYLAFARGESHEESRHIDINQLLQEVIDTRIKNGKMIHFTPDKSLPVVLLRPHMTARALGNLMNNGLRYGNQLWVSLEKFKGTVVISIEDDGPGIAEEKWEDVFKPFFRLDSSRNTSTGGVGLGLSIARDIIRNQGGDIDLSKSEQGGLKAKVTLPL
ncbi:Two-component sensor histidine kinase [Candidatus Bealeia paramacronuclearis]|uniref:histidine kinase n=1 Tax=Candidatus Bealeia paramacronuclearis TaxID=1921001 RepID=A0ABZ2C3R8_9PROT|nr:Two-component sensor histidine kinase [Candidatus Bealeia paramacronuclearis]